MVQPLPDYKNLDGSGEAQQAALRMEARAQEAASAALFTHLVTPLLTGPLQTDPLSEGPLLPDSRLPAKATTVLEVGCGSAALTRRIAQLRPHATVYATDKSVGMLEAARQLLQDAPLANVQLAQWDVLDAAAFPFAGERFDLIVSSVMIPYLEDAQIGALVQRLASWLKPGGTLAFIEQDLHTDSIHFPNWALANAIVAKAQRPVRPAWMLGLRPLLRLAGLTLLPRRSFLWTDEQYGAYTQELLARLADAARDAGAITADQSAEWKQGLQRLADAGDFYYGLVYHLIAGQRIG